MNTKSMLIAASIGGAAMAVLSSIPLIACGNIACCGWVWGSAIAAVWIYRMMEKTQPGLTAGQGAVLGLVSGLVGALLVTVFSTISTLIFGATNAAQYQQLMDQINSMSGSGQLPDWYTQALEQSASPGANILTGAVCNFVIYPLFAVIGGTIAAGAIWKKT